MTNSKKIDYKFKVSVILPTYNQSEFLNEAIQSILNQTFSNFELIIVNDGSTDETANILRTINDPRVQIISQKNQKLPTALNNGFAVAQGEYWTWTSSDNIVTPDWLAELVNALDNAPDDVDYALSYYAVVNKEKKILYINKSQRFDIPTLLLIGNGNASFLYRSSLAKKIGDYDPEMVYAEDLDMWLRMAEHTSAILVPKILYLYRSHENSMTEEKDKVSRATKLITQKWLKNTNGKFIIDNIFPSIKLSANPDIERFKCRLRMATMAFDSTIYTPTEAIIDQLLQAINQYYDYKLVGNIAHLYVKENKWDKAIAVAQSFFRKNKSEFLKNLCEILSLRDQNKLNKIPFLTMSEKLLALDSNSTKTQDEILKNLSMTHNIETESYTRVITELVNQLEDCKDHPETWEAISALVNSQDKNYIIKLSSFINALLQIPQSETVKKLLSVLDAVFSAYTQNYIIAKNKLDLIIQNNPNFLSATGAFDYITEKFEGAKIES